MSLSNVQMTVGTDQKEEPTPVPVQRGGGPGTKRHNKRAQASFWHGKTYSIMAIPFAVSRGFGCNDACPRFDGTRNGQTAGGNNVKRNRPGRLHQRSLAWQCLAAQTRASYRGWKLEKKAKINKSLEFNFMLRVQSTPALEKEKRFSRPVVSADLHGSSTYTTHASTHNAQYGNTSMN
jgi:hypothetical protein